MVLPSNAEILDGESYTKNIQNNLFYPQGQNNHIIN